MVDDGDGRLNLKWAAFKLSNESFMIRTTTRAITLLLSRRWMKWPKNQIALNILHWALNGQSKKQQTQNKSQKRKNCFGSINEHNSLRPVHRATLNTRYFASIPIKKCRKWKKATETNIRKQRRKNGQKKKTPQNVITHLNCKWRFMVVQWQHVV